MLNLKGIKYRAEIMQYSEVIPQTLLERLTNQKPKFRLRIKRQEPIRFNCRCEIRVIV
jgi:redox-regulated HSP33 family molecular chaperone